MGEYPALSEADIAMIAAQSEGHPRAAGTVPSGELLERLTA